MLVPREGRLNLGPDCGDALRRALALLGVAIVLPLAACGGGGGDGFTCTGETCKASFDGAGEQDLSSELGAEQVSLRVVGR